MSEEKNCEKCGQPMRKIGPFATIKPEGEPSQKWDGSIEFQCTNEECDNFGNKVTFKAGE